MTVSYEASRWIYGAMTIESDNALLDGLPALTRAGESEMLNGCVFGNGKAVMGFNAGNILYSMDLCSPEGVGNRFSGVGKQILLTL